MEGNYTALDPCGGKSHQDMFKSNHLAIAIFNLLIATMNVILNSGFAMVLCKSRFLEIPSNSLLLSLAIVDLLTGAIAQTSFAIESFLFSRCVFSKALDIFVAVTGHVLGAMSYSTVILVSLDRYVAILHPFYYELKVTRYRLVTIQFMIWFLPMPLLLFSVFHQNLLSLYYTLISFTITGWLLGVYFYGKILVVACNVIKSDRKVIGTITPSASDHLPSVSFGECTRTLRDRARSKPLRRMIKVQRESRRAITTVCCIMSALLVTFTPITVFSIFMVIRKDLGKNNTEQIILHWVQSVSLVNGLLNPLIYCYRMTDIRRELFRIVGHSR